MVERKLQYKPDFAICEENWTAFWQSELDRPFLQITAPKPGCRPARQPPYLAGCFDDTFDQVLDQLDAWAESHVFLDAALPHYILEFGPDHFAALLGADLEYSAETETSWAHPFVDNWNEVKLTFERRGFWWNKTVEYAERAKERLSGKVLICPPTILANLDALAAVRGANNLLMDLVTQPEVIKDQLNRICDIHDEVLDEYVSLFDFETYGCINRFGGYLPKGKMGRPQCDLACMISPQMVTEFLLPCLERETQVMERAMFHLDGPGATVHTEAICSVEGIDIVQYVPGAGNEDRDWWDLFERIDACGTGQYFYRADREFLWDSWPKLRSKQLLYKLSVESESEGREIVEATAELQKEKTQ